MELISILAGTAAILIGASLVSSYVKYEVNLLRASVEEKLAKLENKENS